MTQRQGDNRYDHQSIEAKWAKVWREVKLDTPDMAGAKKPFYNLMMFPYPSAEGLHVGNMYAFTGSDIFGRLKRMQGHEVFEPIGLDGFGIHSENYAFKVGRHPAEQAKISQENFYRQLGMIGAMFDWTRTLETYDPSYYKWTQWLFVQMFKHGLAYQAEAEVNWCPGCKTVLADEQVISEQCERCGNKVEKKALKQWFFRITAYAEKLLENIKSLSWSEKVLIAQRNWIGKKEGINIAYPVLDGESRSVGELTCFTTRPDTNFGATFVVLAPEHPLIKDMLRVINKKQADVVSRYVDQAKKMSREERIAQGRKKTGVATGLFCINQLNGYRMPLFVSDFVVMEVGTGAVVGVPGHDKRDFEFAQAMELPVIRVVVGPDRDTSPITRIEQVQEEEGKMINSEFLNGFDIRKAITKMMDYLEEKGWGKRVATYHLRDWLISRQRYWGPPIPMIYCEKCAKEGKSWFTTKEARAYHGSSFDSPRQGPDRDTFHSGSFAKAMTGLEKTRRAARLNKLDNWSANWRIGLLDYSGYAGWYPTPEDQLPVELPYIKDYKPGDDGVAPLAKHKEFYHVACPECGSAARRETDVSDTFLDSSWYFLRYPSVNSSGAGPAGRVSRDSLQFAREIKSSSPSSKSSLRSEDSSRDALAPVTRASGINDLPWDPAITKKWLPVNMYTGGAEHSVLHLMYSRFITMALHDWDYLDFDEPFPNFFAHGLVIKDGAKMSKSKGNVVNPDEYIKLYGTDALRLYLMFMGPFSEGGDFRDAAMEGMYRWINRLWRLITAQIPNPKSQISNKFKIQNSNPEIKRGLHRLVKKVTEDTEARRYNTAIAAMMEFTNLVADHGGLLDLESLRTFVLLLAPYAPHLAEELWHRLAASSGETFFGDVRQPPTKSSGASPSSLNEARSPKKRGAPPSVAGSGFSAPQNAHPRSSLSAPTGCWSVHLQPWPSFDLKQLEEDTVEIVIQINGKLRSTCHLSRVTCHDQKEVEKLAQQSAKVAKFLEGKPIKKVIFVRGKLINFVL